MVEISAVGGYGEIGRNMTAVRMKDQVFILDMGLHLPNFIGLSDTMDEYSKVSESSLKRADAIPQDKVINDWKDDVVAIILGHAHLDHIGATPYLAQKYCAPIVCTPFTGAVLRNILQDEQLYLENDIVELKPNKKLKLGSVTIEFIHTTHSTPQTVIVALHSDQGTLLYGNDYKLDDDPTLGPPPNYGRLKELSVKVLIQDCLYAPSEGHTPSESHARAALERAMGSCDPDKALVVTTFSSQIARLKSIAEISRRLDRKIVFAGRSLAKYIWSAKDAGITDLSAYGKVLKYSRQVRAALREVQKKGKDKYVLVVSGHQGEPKSTLAKMIDGTYEWKFAPGDAVIFSSHTIPADINRQNRKIMDSALRKLGVKLYADVHASGHSYDGDLKRMLELVRPDNVLPTHGEDKSIEAFCRMARSLGYSRDKNLFVLRNGDRIQL